MTSFKLCPVYDRLRHINNSYIQILYIPNVADKSPLNTVYRSRLYPVLITDVWSNET